MFYYSSCCLICIQVSELLLIAPHLLRWLPICRSGLCPSWYHFPSDIWRSGWWFIFIGERLPGCNRWFVCVSLVFPWEDKLTLPMRESLLSIHQWEQGGRFGVPIKGKITSVHCPSILSQLRWLSSLPSGSPPGILFICWVFRYCPAPWPQLHSLGCLLASLSQVQRTFLRIRIALHIS